MASTTMFFVQNQEFIWYFLGFIVFVFFAKGFAQITFAIFNAKKGLKIKGRIT